MNGNVFLVKFDVLFLGSTLKFVGCHMMSGALLER